MKAKLNATDWFVQPEYKPLSIEEKHRLTKKAEERFKGFIIGDDRAFELAQYGQVKLKAPAINQNVRPSQMTEEEIIMSINRLAEAFGKSVEGLSTALGV